MQAAKWDCQVSEAECRKSSADENDGIDDILWLEEVNFSVLSS